MSINQRENCPCGSKKSFSQCCEEYLSGNNNAETAEQLMCSRYSAYVKENKPYLKKTWHKETRPENIEFEPKIKWTRLRIKKTSMGGIDDQEGSVEFIATYKINGRALQLHEISRFRRSDGRWVYLDGEHPGTANPG